MGLFKKIFKGIKGAFKGVGKFIKKTFRSFSKLVNKAGIFGQIGMAVLSMYAGGMLWDKLAQSFIGQTVGAATQGITGAARAAMQTVRAGVAKNPLGKVLLEGAARVANAATATKRVTIDQLGSLAKGTTNMVGETLKAAAEKIPGVTFKNPADIAGALNNMKEEMASNFWDAESLTVGKDGKIFSKDLFKGDAYAARQAEAQAVKEGFGSAAIKEKTMDLRKSYDLTVPRAEDAPFQLGPKPYDASQFGEPIVPTTAKGFPEALPTAEGAGAPFGEQPSLFPQKAKDDLLKNISPSPDYIKESQKAIDKRFMLDPSEYDVSEFSKQQPFSLETQSPIATVEQGVGKIGKYDAPDFRTAGRKAIAGAIQTGVTAAGMPTQEALADVGLAYGADTAGIMQETFEQAGIGSPIGTSIPAFGEASNFINTHSTPNTDWSSNAYNNWLIGAYNNQQVDYARGMS